MTLKISERCVRQSDITFLTWAQIAGSDALVAAPDKANGAASVSASLAGLQLEAAEAVAASANGAVEHMAVQMTPLGQTVGLKRKRLQNGR